MKSYLFTFFLLLLLVISGTGQVLHKGKTFELNNPNYPINNSQSYIFEASERINLNPQNGSNADFEYHPLNSNTTFIGRIDLDDVLDVTIQTQNSTNIFSPSNGRDLVEDKAVGKIPASHSVDKVGGFHYTIPIEVPPGTNGVAPNLTLTYSSNSESSMVGLGWRITGLSSIDRTSKTLYYDDVTEPIKYDNTDRFSLNGARLIKDGNYFKFEQEDYSRISYSNVNSNGPTSWLHETVNGIKMYYGTSANSRIIHGTKRISWLVDKSVDNNGNYIEYKYREINGQKVIDEIGYTGNQAANLQTYNKVKFVYVNRNKPYIRYYRGYAITEQVLLKKIVTYSHGSPIYEYSIDYSHQSHNYIDGNNNPVTFTQQIPLLNQIKLKSFIDGSEYHATLFNYKNNNTTTTKSSLNINSLKSTNKAVFFSLGDFNNDGISDVAQYDLTQNNQDGLVNKITLKGNNGDGSFSNLQTPISVSSPGKAPRKLGKDARRTHPRTSSQYQSANTQSDNGVNFKKIIGNTDLNDDGKDDIIYFIEYNSITTVRKIYSGSTTPQSLMTFQTIDATEYDFTLAEFTGDGLVDGVGYYKNGINKFYLHNSSLNTTYTVSLTNVNWLSFQNPVKYKNITPFDLDGDGTVELIFWEYKSVNNLPQGPKSIHYTFLDIIKFGSSYTLKEIKRGTNLGGLFRDKIQVGDFNADGISDLYFIPDDQFVAYLPELRIGDGDGNYSSILTPSLHDPDDLWSFVDINGDKFFDLMKLSKGSGSTTNVKVFYSNGSSLMPHNYPIINEDMDSLLNFSFGDFDGDNSLELFFVKYYQDAQNTNNYSYTPRTYKFSSGPKANKLVGIRNGLNQDLIISYQFNSEPSAIFDLGQQTGHYLQSFNSSASGLSAKNVFLNKNVLLTTKISASIAVNQSTINDNLYDYTEDYFYHAAVFNKVGKGLLGMIGGGSKFPYSNEGLNWQNEWNSTCNCLIPKESLIHAISNDKILSKEILNISVTSLLNGKRYLIQKQSSVSKNFEKGIEKTTDYDYYTTGAEIGNLKKITINDGVYENSTEFESYGQYGTFKPMHPTQIYSKKNNLALTGDYSTRTVLNYDGDGNLKLKTTHHNTSKAITKNIAHDDFGNKTQIITSGTGVPTLTKNFDYDDNGQFIEWSQNIKGQITKYDTYKHFGLPKSIKSPNNNITTYEYDGLGRKTAVRHPNGVVTHFKLDWNTTPNQIDPNLPPIFSHKSLYYAEVSEEGSPTQKTIYDFLGREVAHSVDGWGDKVVSSKQYKYDPINKTNLLEKSAIPHFSQSTDPVKYINYEYDEYNRLKKTIHPQYGSKEITYPPIQSSITGIPANYLYEITSTGYDGESVTSKTNPAGEVVSTEDSHGILLYSYNNQGLQTRVKLKENQSSAPIQLASMSYDPVDGSQTQLIDANAGTINYTYDPYGRLKSQVDSKGTTTLNYNNYNELISKVNPVANIQYTYVNNGNGLNQLKQITHSGGNDENFQYDKLGNVIKHEITIDNNNTYKYNYELDQLGRLKNKTYPSGFSIKYDYTAEGFMNKITEGNSQNIIWEAKEVNAFGQFVKVDKGNGVTTKYDYHDSYYLKEKHGEVNLDYIFDANTGNLSKRTNIDINHYEDFQYVNNRLTKMTLDATTIQEIDYDFKGNIQDKGDINDYLYPLPSGKFNAVVGLTDNSGSISIQYQQIDYNALNQPQSISEGNYEMEFKYGADGQRVSSELKDNSTLKRTRHYLPEYEKQVFTANNKEQLIHYIAGADGLAAIYVIENGVGTMYYTYTDYLGSILKVTDDAGNTVAEQSFDAWGRKRNTSNWSYTSIASTPDWLYRGYTGHEHYEEFALINMNGRMYDPIIGRMLSADNFVQNGASTQAYNRYTYAANNPLKYTDPTGEVFGVALGAFMLRGIIGHFSGESSSEIFRSAGSAAIAVAAPIHYGMATGAISGQNSNYGFYGGAIAGMGMATLGSTFAGIGGGSFIENVAWGAGEGALLGGVNAAIWGNDIGEGVLNGATYGAIYATGSMLLEMNSNYEGGFGFRTINSVISNLNKNGKYDQAIDYVQSKYGLTDVKMDYDASEGNYGVTNPNTGDVKIGSSALKSPSMLKATIAHEYGHSKIDRVLDANGNFLGWKYPTNSFSSSNPVLSKDGPLGYAQEIFNAGNMNIDRTAITDPNINPLWNEWSPQIGGSKFLHSIPRRTPNFNLRYY